MDKMAEYFQKIINDNSVLEKLEKYTSIFSGCVFFLNSQGIGNDILLLLGIEALMISLINAYCSEVDKTHKIQKIKYILMIVFEIPCFSLILLATDLSVINKVNYCLLIGGIFFVIYIAMIIPLLHNE